MFADIRTAAADWPDAQRVFLADGDAMALPTEHLLAILRELAAALPKNSTANTASHSKCRTTLRD